MAFNEPKRFMGLLDPEMIKGYRAVCEKHGDVSEASFFFDYKILDKETNKAKNYQSIYCIPCLNEFFMKQQEDGVIPKVMLYELPTEEDLKKEAETKEESVHEVPVAEDTSKEEPKA